MLYQATCDGTDHLRKELARIESLGGEGLMLRQPGSLYEAGRSHTLLKVKRFHDAEARVIEHLPGAGRHKGRLGALLVELPGGTRFSVGTGFTDAQREKPPAIGSVITFRFQELTDGGVPRFPSVRPRAQRPAGQAASSEHCWRPPMLEVLEVGYWAFGGGTHRAHLCEGQITKCRWFGIVFYVRENLDGGWSFYISSNERMSDKGSNRGTGRPAMHRNVLDLCTPHEVRLGNRG